ncbi:unnamed protein product [Adineta ricciae]|uniref:Uncharacterized protein n=1 Tax=Adineta ricciae TaxID=249248 RepID=A0A816HBE3_ADIRI|nr:unnamed protein product [Adineta ricciae]
MSGDIIRVETSDNQILEVKSTIAKQWAPIKVSELLNEDDTPDKPPVRLENVNAEVLKKIIEWAEYHQGDEIEDEDGQPRAKRVVYLQDWDKKYFNIDQQMIFEIIMASNYLGMIKLLDMACKTIADMIKDKTPEEVRQTFNIPNDLEDPQVCDDSCVAFF